MQTLQNAPGEAADSQGCGEFTFRIEFTLEGISLSLQHVNIHVEGPHVIKIDVLQHKNEPSNSGISYPLLKPFSSCSQGRASLWFSACGQQSRVLSTDVLNSKSKASVSILTIDHQVTPQCYYLFFSQPSNFCVGRACISGHVAGLSLVLYQHHPRNEGWITFCGFANRTPACLAQSCSLSFSSWELADHRRSHPKLLTQADSVSAIRPHRQELYFSGMAWHTLGGKSMYRNLLSCLPIKFIFSNVTLIS